MPCLSDNTHAERGHNIGPIAYAAPVPRAIQGLIGFLFTVLCASPWTAHAASPERIAAWVAAVESGDPTQALVAIDELSKQPVAVRVPLFADLVRKGQPDPITEHLVLTLGASRSDLALTTLQRAAQHRLASIRVAAQHALSNFRDRADVAALVANGLRDSDPTVRAAAADSLVSMNAVTEVNALLVAFDRGVPEAAVALGTLADDNMLVAFTAFLGRKPIEHMLAGYRAWLLRRDVAINTKLAIVATLEDVSGVTVKRFLQAFADSDDKALAPELRRAIAATIARIPEPHARSTQP